MSVRNLFLMIAFVTCAALPVAAGAQDHDHGAGESANDVADSPGHEDSAHEGEAHEHEGISGTGLAASFVNFFILLGIVVYLAKKPTKEFLISRRANVVDGLEEAKRLKAAAEVKFAEYQKRLANLDNELADLRNDIVKSGEAERDRIVAEAEHKAARLRRDTQFLIEQQLKQLRVDLTRETVEAAIAAAQTVLAETTTTTDQERVAREYLSKLVTEKSEAAQ
ncbi:MAG: ATP synthase F0 subunit B [Sandaracinaceae bacterium]|jgi:F-type H+-transporting ATPase subunit b|nr:ATP synthase F0 subunit B [Sandaracinaceae bacterium]